MFNASYLRPVIDESPLLGRERNLFLINFKSFEFHRIFNLHMPLMYMCDLLLCIMYG